ncbi:hypothetical protein WR25_10973 [Diploscapter pachys]|uniref:Transcriptional coactivator p15 (PC4) C-terminal domain-containing protein n=1 Tax=Diploscapter pachys TaxID=2018661 RepID=A0A2A2LY51_9BILA|nr:hypothetical protein WR25_10973 [Diploscapter pachys]
MVPRQIVIFLLIFVLGTKAFFTIVEHQATDPICIEADCDEDELCVVDGNGGGMCVSRNFALHKGVYLKEKTGAHRQDESNVQVIIKMGSSDDSSDESVKEQKKQTKKRPVKDESDDSGETSDTSDSAPAPKKAKSDDKGSGKGKAAGSGKSNVRKQVNSEGQTMLELGSNKFVTVGEFKGKKLIQIREYYLDKGSGELKPGKKGIALSREQYDQLKGMIGEIDGML